MILGRLYHLDTFCATSSCLVTSLQVHNESPKMSENESLAHIPEGETVRLTGTGSDNISLAIIEKGLHIQSIVVKDKQGKEHDVIIAPDSSEEMVSKRTVSMLSDPGEMSKSLTLPRLYAFVRLVVRPLHGWSLLQPDPGQQDYDPRHLDLIHARLIWPAWHLLARRPGLFGLGRQALAKAEPQGG